MHGDGGEPPLLGRLVLGALGGLQHQVAAGQHALLLVGRPHKVVLDTGGDRGSLDMRRLQHRIIPKHLIKS